MADIIKVSTEELINGAAKYETLQHEFEDAYMRMLDAVTTVDASWNGDASEAYVNQFNEMYQNLRQTSDKMQDAVTELKETANIIDEVEQALQSGAQSLEVGPVPSEFPAYSDAE